MASIREEKLDFWLKHGQNTLLLGREGIGKTTTIRESLVRNGLEFGKNAAYYSPHDKDFVGDPTTAQVIVFDDLNDLDAQKAANEVLGLRLWRGKPVTAFVWGSFTHHLVEAEPSAPNKNPASPKVVNWKQPQYDLEDAPASLVRLFDVHVEVPYKPHLDWFIEKFGDRPARAAVGWWDDLDDEEKKKVSPKRLASALTMWKNRGDMRDVLPLTSNVSKLSTALNTGPMSEKLEDLMKSGDVAAVKLFLANENNYQAAMKYVPKSESFMKFFLPLLSEEKLAALMASEDDQTNRNVTNHLLANFATVPVFRTTIKKVLDANTNVRLAKRLRRALNEQQMSEGFPITETTIQ